MDSQAQVPKGILLLIIRGAGFTPSALLDHHPDNAYAGVVRPIDQKPAIWILRCLLVDADRQAELAKRTCEAAMPDLNLDNIRGFRGSPPLFTEPQCTVASVNAPLSLCDRLEASSAATVGTCRRLQVATLDEAQATAKEYKLEGSE
jgi:hypothetical protein